jgi:hypothetical protein
VHPYDSVRVASNTVCHNAGAAILGEGSFSDEVPFAPNMGIGNVLEGEIFQNTATTVVVQDETSGNTADVTQFKNVPCPELRSLDGVKRIPEETEIRDRDLR